MPVPDMRGHVPGAPLDRVHALLRTVRPSSRRRSSTSSVSTNRRRSADPTSVLGITVQLAQAAVADTAGVVVEPRRRRPEIPWRGVSSSWLPLNSGDVSFIAQDIHQRGSLIEDLMTSMKFRTAAWHGGALHEYRTWRRTAVCAMHRTWHRTVICATLRR
eukprot:1380895-Rhodomonas_salina.6